jgi:hypothetical protein
MICNEYVSLYFFSAVFQGNMALLALLGVFVVFKRQELTSEIQGKDAAIVSYVQNYLDLIVSQSKHVAINYPNVEALPNIILNMSNDQTLNNTIRARCKALHEDSNFNARFTERSVLVEKRRTVASSMVEPFGWILFIIIASLALLPFVHSIHTKTPWLELALIIATITLNIWALYRTTKFAFKMLRQ